MFGNTLQNQELPMIIVADEKDMVYANYLIQLIGQKDDAGDSIVGIEDDSLSAAIYTPKIYKDNLSQIPSSQHISSRTDMKPSLPTSALKESLFIPIMY